MAFNFNGLSRSMGQTNIFDPSSPETQSGQSNMYRTSGPSLAPGSVTPSGGVDPVKAPSVQQNYTPGQAMQAFAGVKGTDTSKAVGGIQGNIQSAQQKLQDRANEYGQKVETAKAGQALSADTIQGAIQGNDKAFQDVSGRLNQAGAKAIDRFEGLKDDELPTLADPLAYKETWGEIFRPQAGANYTGGQSNYEDILLGRNGQFGKLAATLGNQQAGLVKQNGEMADSETKKAQDILDADWKTQTDAIRGQLSGASQSVVADAKAREAAEEARRSGLSPDLIQHEVLAKQRPYQEDVLRASGLDGYGHLLNDSNAYNGLSNYIKLNQDVDYKDLISEDEASRFNRIQALLGGGETLAAGRGAQPDYTFDEQGGNAYIQSVLAGKARDQKAVADTQAEAQREVERVAAAEAEKQRMAAEKAELDRALKMAKLNKALTGDDVRSRQAGARR